METSKRRQIPTTNACQNFIFRGIRIKKNFVTLKNYFRHAENYFRHAEKVHTSQQRQRPIQYAHALAILLWPQPAGPSVRPGLRPVLFATKFCSNETPERLFRSLCLSVIFLWQLDKHKLGPPIVGLRCITSTVDLSPVFINLPSPVVFRLFVWFLHVLHDVRKKYTTNNIR